MQKLVAGIHQFTTKIFSTKQELFDKLAKGQQPIALFLTCSDSRINPNLVTQTEPGEIFVIRNAGNIVPAFPESGGELATIEFAMNGLNIQDIIVCGHSDCGAMKGVLNHSQLPPTMPHLKRWLSHASRTSDIMKTQYKHLTDGALLTATVEENVLVQIENLKSHPFIALAIEEGKLKIHAWVYKFETGQVFAFEPSVQQFIPLNENIDQQPAHVSASSQDAIRSKASEMSN